VNLAENPDQNSIPRELSLPSSSVASRCDSDDIRLTVDKDKHAQTEKIVANGRFQYVGTIDSRMSFNISACSSIFNGSQAHAAHHERNVIVALVVGVIACIAWVEVFKSAILDPRLEPEIAYEPKDYPVAPLNDFRWDWTGKGITGTWSTSTFVTYQCVLAWFTCSFTGLLLEFMVGQRMISLADKITEQHEAMWKFAQFLFPFMILVGILLVRNGNALGMVFGVIGMWKFGFPETISIMSQALRSSTREKFSHHTVVFYLKAYGKLVHHSSSMVFFCVFAMGASPMTRPCLAITLPLVVQHLMVPLKYVSYGVYAVIETVVEVWFEMEVFANVEFFYYPHGVDGAQHVYNPMIIRGVIAIVSAHWFYFLAGIIDIVGKICSKHRRREQHDPEAQCMESPTMAKRSTVQVWKANMIK
jgi:hypothetical protein